MSGGGKGSKSRPLSVEREVFDNNWDAIFEKKPENYQDFLSTEDCVLDSFEDALNGKKPDN
jgi:hypothetical protein